MGNFIDLKPLTKPVETLMKKISNAVGVLYEPKRIEREAEAQAKADKIKAKSEIEITDLQKRAARRRMKEEMKYQQNMESITAKSLPQLNENADASQMDDDWIANFFDKCRIVSDDEMQTLWWRILAGEANTPGSYSKRTVNCLSEMDKTEAEMFRNLCAFCWHIAYTSIGKPTDIPFLSSQDCMEIVQAGKMIPLVFDPRNAIYNKHGINLDVLNHLDSIGLIHFNFLDFSDTFRTALNTNMAFGLYHDKLLCLKNPEPSSNFKHSIGKVSFTQIGEQLATLCKTEPIDGFYDYIKTKWSKYSPMDIAIEF